jgi:Xaa-Pro aminopeptidase
MFESSIYEQRRRALAKRVGSGMLLFLGNGESPMNYPANTFHFRQDSSFLYYWGLELPGLAAILDAESGKESLFGDDLTVDDIVWMGPQPTIRQLGERTGVRETHPMAKLGESIEDALRLGRRVHFLPQYRGENLITLSRLTGIGTSLLPLYVSHDFVRAVVAQRSHKASEEISEIEIAIDITGEMQTLAMKTARPGMIEREVAGAMHGRALSMGGNLAFPIIFSIHGETLHNHHHNNVMKAGDIVVNDSGAETATHYAGDITRTFPVSGKFTQRQKDVYRVVLRAQKEAIREVKPGVRFKDVHLGASKCLVEGLKELGLMKGDPDEAVRRGAHALFFQCGLGHMMGLDVHDMEGLGEQYVGYDETVQRDPQFGICYLRLARALEPGFVLTVEPGIYLIPELIDLWKGEGKHRDFINYDVVEKFRDFGGIRIEDDVVVTESGCRVLGKPIPKELAEVETLAGA